jgi:hypothetical protein
MTSLIMSLWVVASFTQKKLAMGTHAQQLLEVYPTLGEVQKNWERFFLFYFTRRQKFRASLTLWSLSSAYEKLIRTETLAAGHSWESCPLTALQHLFFGGIFSIHEREAFFLLNDVSLTSFASIIVGVRHSCWWAFSL